MTQVIASKANYTIKELQRKLAANFEGISNKDGTFKNNQSPGVQSFIRKEGTGDYVVVHNLNRLDYSLNVGLATQPGTFKISDQNAVSFRLETFLDRKPTDFEFRFNICVIGD